MRILIIDDGPAGLDLANHLRSMYGAETFLAKTMGEGLEKRVSVKRIDSIVLDLSLDDSSREQTIASIPVYKEIAPVFVFTGYADKDLFEQCLANGAEDWFLKGPYQDDKGIDRGSAGLAKRLFVEWRKKNISEPNHVAAQESAVDDARHVVESRPDSTKLEWLTHPVAALATFITNVGVLIGLIVFVTLFWAQVRGNTSDIATLKQRDEVVKIENQQSKDQRATIEKRQDAFDARVNAIDLKMDGLSRQLADLPWKVRDLVNDAKK